MQIFAVIPQRLDTLASPTFAALTVAGNITHEGDADTYLGFLTDQYNFNAGGKVMLDLRYGPTGALRYCVVNQGGEDIDFGVESTGDASLIRTDAANDKVGIGTATPAEKLDVNGNVKATGNMEATANITAKYFSVVCNENQVVCNENQIVTN